MKTLKTEHCHSLSASGHPFNCLGHTIKGKSNVHLLQTDCESTHHLTPSSRPSPPTLPAHWSSQSDSWLYSEMQKHPEEKPPHFPPANVAPASISCLINVVQVQCRSCFKGRKKEVVMNLPTTPLTESFFVMLQYLKYFSCDCDSLSIRIYGSTHIPID